MKENSRTVTQIRINFELLQEQVDKKSSIAEINTFLQKLLDFVNKSPTNLKNTDFLCEEISLQSLKDIFDNFFTDFLRRLLQKLKRFYYTKETDNILKNLAGILSTLNCNVILSSVLKIFKEERDSTLLLYLSSMIVGSTSSQSLLVLLWKQAQEKPLKLTHGKPCFASRENNLWNDLTKLLVSVPDVVANKLQLNNNSDLLRDVYLERISDGILNSLKKIHHALQNSVDCSLVFLSMLIAKICSTGHADTFYKVSLSSLQDWSEKSPLWRRICSKLFLSVPDLYQEAVLNPFVAHPNVSPEFLASIYDDAMLSRPKLKLFFTHKCFLVRIFENDWIPYCILKYISSKTSLETIFKEMFFNLLEVWGSRNSIKHTSLEQHIYISKCILIAVGCFTSQQKQQWKAEIVRKMMDGIPAHLESLNSQLHQIGMIMGECLTGMVDGDKKLDFELEKTKDVEYLISLAKDPESTILRPKPEVVIKEKEVKECPDMEELIKPTSSVDLDSDDEEDLVVINPETLDQEDGTVNGVRPPIYLRDCIAGLLSKEDPNRLEACLRVIEKLVEKDPPDLKDVCVEIVGILLHLQDDYAIEDFYTVCSQAMVAIIVKQPVKVSEYLCGEFYEENYAIPQRLLILEIISAGAVKLSSTKVADKVTQLVPSLHRSRQEVAKPEWRSVVDERIKSNTRRFIHGPQSEPVKIVENRFSHVAGSFFFPLLTKFGHRLNTCDMLGRDSMVLARFINCLSMVLGASKQLPIINVMAKQLLGVIWSLRYHKEAHVRSSLIFGLICIVVNVQPHYLLTELQTEIFEARQWIADLITHDTDRDCQRMAIQCYKHMEEQLTKEIFGAT